MTILTILLYALGLVSGIGIIIYVSYLGLMLSLYIPFTYKDAFKLIVFVFLMALMSGGISYILPDDWHSIVSILMIHFGCMLAFHVFFFKIEEFLAAYCNYTVSPWVLNSVIGLMYIILSINGVVLTMVHSPLILRVGHMGIEYLGRTAVLFSLLLEIKLRKHAKESLHIAQPKVQQDEYQNYDNQW